jgi:hypothetical protein
METLKKQEREVNQKIEETRGKIRLTRKIITSLFHILNELTVRKKELKKEIRESEKRRRK